ncbi:MAG: hypothetical protein JSR80_00420 [Verrucomicrobia bacterium]|nr:hypothetical protein [Verrucomicrobiota bacterium]
MTTVVAVKKGQRACIASDSLAIYRSTKELDGKHVYGNGKMIQIGPNYIGTSGDPIWALILNHYFLTYRKTLEWSSTEKIFELFNEMHETLKDNYYLRPPSLKFLPFESSEFQLLIVNPSGIFEVEYSRVVRQYNKYSAIGTGEDYALGALSAIYDVIEDPEEIAKMGIAAAAQFDRKTMGPIHTYCIDLIS